MKTIQHIFFSIITAILVIAGLSSCVDDLNTIPLDPEEHVSDIVFTEDIAPYQQLLAKIYACLLYTSRCV